MMPPPSRPTLAWALALALIPGAASAQQDVPDPFCEGAWGIQTALGVTRLGQVKQAPLRLQLESTRLGVRPFAPTPALLELFPDATPAPSGMKGRRLFVGGRKESLGQLPFAVVTYDRELVGDVDVRVTVSLDDLKGIQDGATRAVFEIDTPPGGPPFGFTNLEARFDAELPGFRVTADTSLGPLTEQVVEVASHEVELRMRRDGAVLWTYARAAPEDGAAGGWSQVSVQVVDPDDSFELALGVIAVGKGGRVFLDRIRVEGAALGGLVERPLVELVAAATAPLVDAGRALAEEGVGADLEAVTAWLQSALDDVAAARVAIQAAADDETLLAGTEASRALAALDRSAKRGATALAQVEAGGAGKVDRAVRNITRAIDHATTSVANLMGHRAKGRKALPLGELPPD